MDTRSLENEYREQKREVLRITGGPGGVVDLSAAELDLKGMLERLQKLSKELPQATKDEITREVASEI